MYELVFDKPAIEFLTRAQNPIKERIYKKLIAAKLEPRRFFGRLTGRKDYKLRVGDYRIIADIDDGA